MPTPFKITPALKEQVADYLCTPFSTMFDAAKMIGVTEATLHRALIRDSEFDAIVARARKVAAAAEVDQLDKIAQEEQDVQRAKLRCDNVKWKAGKRYAEVYGDRIDVNVTERISIVSALDAAEGRVRPVRDLPDIEDAQVIEAQAPLPALPVATEAPGAQEGTLLEREADEPPPRKPSIFD